eukprot:COSAG01_NODE_64775_length_275_cov_0.869318_1_plen_40_part_10
MRTFVRGMVVALRSARSRSNFRRNCCVVGFTGKNQRVMIV